MVRGPKLVQRFSERLFCYVYCAFAANDPILGKKLTGVNKTAIDVKPSEILVETVICTPDARFFGLCLAVPIRVPWPES